MYGLAYAHMLIHVGTRANAIPIKYLSFSTSSHPEMSMPFQISPRVASCLTLQLQSTLYTNCFFLLVTSTARIRQSTYRKQELIDPTSWPNQEEKIDNTLTDLHSLGSSQIKTLFSPFQSLNALAKPYTEIDPEGMRLPGRQQRPHRFRNLHKQPHHQP